MPDRSFLDWPFFDDDHRRLAVELEGWATRELGSLAHADDLDGACRDIAGRLGADGWLRHVVPRTFGGSRESLDVRSLCLIRETLARHAPLADFVRAVSGSRRLPSPSRTRDPMWRRCEPPRAAPTAAT